MNQSEKEIFKIKLLKLLSSAIECDSWGQILEATEAYEK